jgi:hypothetical protein
MNYTTLQTQVASYLHRTDLASQIPTFIELAEAYMFRELHIKEMQVSVTGTTTSGYATLPADFGSVSRVTVTYANYTKALDYIALGNAPTATTSAPAYYSLENDKLRIWGAADGQAYTLYYIPAIQNLSATVPTNWLLDNAPELYLDAACLQGAKYTRNDAEVAKLTDNVAMSIDSVKRFSERRGQPATGSMQIKVRRG